MRFVYILLAILVLTALFSLPQLPAPRQRGGYYFSDDTLPDPPMNNELYLEKISKKEGPLTPQETRDVTHIAVNVNRSDKFIHEAEQAIAKNLPEYTQPHSHRSGQEQREDRAGTTERTERAERAERARREEPQTEVKNYYDPTEFTNHYERKPPAAKNLEQQQIVRILLDSQKDIDKLRSSMERSKNLLLELSAKIENTDLSTASTIHKLIKCPVCPLTEPGVMKFTNVERLSF